MAVSLLFLVNETRNYDLSCRARNRGRITTDMIALERFAATMLRSSFRGYVYHVTLASIPPIYELIIKLKFQKPIPLLLWLS